MLKNLAKTLFVPCALIALIAPLGGSAVGEARRGDDAAVFADAETTVLRLENRRAIGSRVADLYLTIRGNEEKLHAREVVEFVLEAVDEEGNLVRDAFAVIDFGNGRDMQSTFDRRLHFDHIWRDEGGYRVQVELYDQRVDGELLARGKTRVKLGGPLRTTLQILGEEEAELDEEVRYRFIALEEELRAVEGELTIDWGDGNSEVVENFVKEVSRSHVYTEEGTYELTATLVRDDEDKPRERSLSVVVSETSTVDLTRAIVPINSARDIANFRVTSQITNVTVSGSLICIFHTKAGGWPVKDGVEGNPWVAVFINGQLHAGTYEWLRPGQVCKGITANNIGPHVKHGTLAQWRPKKGEQVWFFVSTHSRLGSRTIDERAEPFPVIWPY